MKKLRKNYTANFKSRVSLEAIKEQSPLSELSQKYGVHVTQIQKWKTQLQQSCHELFEDKRTVSNQTKLISSLHEKIGQLTVERDFLGKVLDH